MRAYFKFLRTINGISSFAAVGVECVPSSAFAVQWAEGIARFESYYPNAVEAGIAEAHRWHQEMGGGPAQFVVTEFLHLEVDTRADAVRCAATAAAWKALGQNEADLHFEKDGEWRVFGVTVSPASILSAVRTADS